MRLEINCSVKERHDDEIYPTVSYCDDVLRLYIQNNLKDDCTVLDLTTAQARHLALQLETMADYVDNTEMIVK